MSRTPAVDPLPQYSTGLTGFTGCFAAAPPRPLLHLCRLRIRQLVGPEGLNKLLLPGALIRFLKHQLSPEVPL